MSHVRTREWASTDYYAELDVEPGASPTRIDQRYRDLAKALHPDRTQDVADQERFKRVSTAYRALRDPSTRAAYDGFRHQIATGTLEPAYSGDRVVQTLDHLAPPRRPRTRAPMPEWLRNGIALVLILLGVAAALWAALGEPPAPASADTPLAVQITLVIMAVKLWACGAMVAWYPQLRARWHR